MWAESGRDCNSDSFVNILDFVCMVNITPNLDPPVFETQDDLLVSVGEHLEFSLFATDPNGDPLVFSVHDLPANASFDTQTQLFTFDPDASQFGTLILTFIVDDGFSRIYQDVAITIINLALCSQATISGISSSPAHGDLGVAVTRKTIIRFGVPLAPATEVDTTKVFATFGGTTLATTLHMSRNRKTVTLFYHEILPESARIRLTILGDELIDENGCALDGDGDGMAGGTALIDFDTLSLSVVEGTSVCGRVFASELVNVEGSSLWVNEPLEGVLITLDGMEDTVFTITDALGDFRLEPVPSGEFFVHIDGATADNPKPMGAYYPKVGKSWVSVAGQEVNLNDIFLPLIAPDTLVAVSETEIIQIGFPESVLANHPDYEGVTIKVPAGSLFADDGTPGGSVGLAPVEPDRLPGILPEGLTLPLVVTVQTDGATNFDVPAPICLPNLANPETGLQLPPGAKSALWSFNHDAGRWEVIGPMTVSGDGEMVCTDPGVGIRAPGWHGANPGTGGGGGQPGPPQPPEDPKKPMTPAPAEPGECKDPANESDNPTDPIYLFSGEFYETVEDLRIKGRGMDFVWTRTYRSRWGPNTLQGNGWDFSYNVFLETSGSLLRTCEGNGRRDDFFPKPGTTNTWIRNEFFSELTREPDDRFTMTFPNLGTWQYCGLSHPDAPGKLEKIQDRNGNRILLQYDGAGRLVTITDTLDREITVSYNEAGLIAAVTDFSGRSITYSYYDGIEPGGSFGDLKSVTSPAVIGTPNGNDFPDGKTTRYTYSTGFADSRLNGNLLTITDPKGQTYLENHYAETEDPTDFEFDHVVRQVWGNPDDIIHISYLPVQPDADNGGALTRTIVNDRMGNVSEFFFDLGNRVVVHRAYTGRAIADQVTTDQENRPVGKLRSEDPKFFETRNEWNADALLTRTVHPNGNITEFVYESDLDPTAPARTRANLKILRRLPGGHKPAGDQEVIEEHFEYDSEFGCGSCGFNFVTKHTDGRGNDTYYSYDEQGNQVLIQERISGIIEEFEYNEYGQMTARIHPDNGSGHRRRDETTYYDSGPMNGYLQSRIVDADVKALTRRFEYDVVGNMVRTVDPRGHDRQYVFNTLDQLIREISREVLTGIRYEKDYRYDLNDNLVQLDIQNRDGSGSLQANTHFTQSFTYEILNHRIARTEEVNQARALTVDYAYDANRNRILERSGEAVNGNQPENLIATSYDERNLIFRMTRAAGHEDQSTTQYDYDHNRNKVRRIMGLEEVPHVIATTFDGYDRRMVETDAMGNQILYHYDANHNITGVRKEGELQDVVGDNDNVRLWDEVRVYDELDRMIRTEVAFFDTQTQTAIDDGLVTTHYAYSDFSEMILLTDDNDHKTTYDFDSVNRIQTETDASGNIKNYVYDANDNIISLTEVERSDLGLPDEVFTTTFEYDNLDRRIRLLDNAGNSHDFAYDSRNNKTLMVDALANVTRYQYDGLNRMTQTTVELTADGTGNSTQIGTILTSRMYDDSSRLVKRIDSNGNETTYVYDPLNRQTGIIYADGTVLTKLFDVHDVVVSMTDPNGNAVAHGYDLLDRMIRKDIVPGPDISADTTFENYGYDGLSRMVRMEDDDSLLQRAYDSPSRVVSETLNGQTTAAIFDGVGNMLTCTYPSGRTVTRTFDELDRPENISDQAGSIADYDYVGPDRVTRRDYANGSRMDMTYDGVTGVANPIGDFGVKRVVAIKHSRIGGGSIIDERTFTWDPMYNKTIRRDQVTGQSHAYGYDSAYRLVYSIKTPPGMESGGRIDYTFDEVQNRLNVTGGETPGNYQLDDNLPEPGDYQLNQYTITPLDQRLYDRNGNLSRIDAGLPGERRFTYDYRNRMVGHEDIASATNVYYAYDVLGRRTARLVNGGTPKTTLYFYNDWRVVEEQDEANTETASYVYGNYIDEVLTMRRDGVDFYYHSDDLHNVTKITDSSAIVVEQYDYDDYGMPLFFNGAGTTLGQSSLDNPYSFMGRRYDDETKFLYFRTRYNDLAVGRFTSRDHIGIWADIPNLGNGFTFVSNSPFTYLDPLGYESDECGYYDKVCKETRGIYYCYFAPNVCKSFDDLEEKMPKPAENWSKCVRPCLQICDKAMDFNNNCQGRPDADREVVGCHALCFVLCMF